MNRSPDGRPMPARRSAAPPLPRLVRHRNATWNGRMAGFGDGDTGDTLPQRTSADDAGRATRSCGRCGFIACPLARRQERSPSRHDPRALRERRDERDSPRRHRVVRRLISAFSARLASAAGVPGVSGAFRRISDRPARSPHPEARPAESPSARRRARLASRLRRRLAILAPSSCRGARPIIACSGVVLSRLRDHGHDRRSHVRRQRRPRRDHAP